MNIWVKRSLSLLSILFGVLIGYLSYLTLFYNVSITNKGTFMVFILAICLFFGTAMIYTRKQFVTSLVSMVLMPIFLPSVILYFGEWMLLIPLAIVIVVMFFACGAGEGIKTILGAGFILLYILSAIGFYLFSTIIMHQTEDIITQKAISSSENYRCYVVNVTDTSKGRTKVYVEPNTYDIEYPGITFMAKGYKRLIYNVRSNQLQVKLEWKSDPKGYDELYVNDELRFKELDALKKEEPYNWFSKEKRKIEFE